MTMGDQISLLDDHPLAPVHADDGDESRQAAAKVDAQDQYRRVLIALYEHGPQTDDQLAARCRLLRTSAGTRRGVATKRRLVEKVGVGTSNLGNPAGIWALTELGRQVVRQMLEGASDAA